MISFYKIDSPRDEELLDAISLLEREYEKNERDTPEKMAQLIFSNFDIPCDSEKISKLIKIR